MADVQVTPWDQVNVDEEISETDQAASNDISMSTPVGKFLCTVVACDAIENAMSAYTCYQANLKMRIDKVVKIEQPVFDKDKKPIVRNGEPVKKVLDVPADQVAKINALYAGRFIFDGINLYNPAEKEAMKNRRLFVAKRLGLITPQATSLPTSAWPGSIGRQVIVETEHNSWKIKDKATGIETGEIGRNVKVGWSGYDYTANAVIGAGGGQGTGADTSFNVEEFDI